MIVLVHSGITGPEMWDGFELPGEVLRQRLSEPISVDAPVALVGASYGGLVCLDFAARHPERVTGLVLLDAPLPDHDWSDEMRGYADEEERLIEAGDLDAATELNIAYWAPKAVADRLARELPDAERALIPGAAHLPSLERPEATAALVEAFLKAKSLI